MLEADGGERGSTAAPVPLPNWHPRANDGVDRAPIPIAASTCSARWICSKGWSLALAADLSRRGVPTLTGHHARREMLAALHAATWIPSQ